MTEHEATVVVRRRRRRRAKGVRGWWRSLGRRGRILIVAGGVVLVGLLWTVVVVWSTIGDLREAERSATIMRAALVRGDASGARSAMADYQDAAESAEGRTDGVTWSVLERVPLLGDDLTAVGVVSAALADIGRDGLPPLVDAAEQVTADAFQPEDHTFPMRTIAAMQEPARQSEQAFDKAATQLEEVRVGGLSGPLRTRFDTLQALVVDARDTLGSTYRAARLMPRMLGGDQPRRFLLVLENNAELRSAGGLPGSLSLVEARSGRVEIVDQLDTAELPPTDEPVLPLHPDEEVAFGSILGTVPVDATLTPDFERSSELLAAHWSARTGRSLDGVIYVDPVAVSYLLTGVGQVPVPGYQPVDASTVVAAVENTIYLGSPDPAVHSAYQHAIAESVFDAFADGQGDSVEAVRGLARGVTEGRIRMHFFDDDLATEIEGTEIAGELPSLSDPATIGIYLNDAGPSKMNYYLEYDASATARACADQRQEIAGSLRLRSNTPDDVDRLPPSVTGEGFPGSEIYPGEQRLLIYLTSPVGGRVTELVIDGRRMTPPAVHPFFDRELAAISIRLDPGQEADVDFVVTTGRRVQGDARLTVTPGAVPGTSNAVIPSAC